jgi:hypothetical protein
MFQINGSIAKHTNIIWCAYRTRHLHEFNAECYLAQLDFELNTICDKKLIAENGNTAFEDIRLFSFENNLLAFYNYLPFQTGGGWKNQYGIGYGVIDIETGIIKNQISLRGLSTRFHEKNWSPYIYHNELFMITDFDPFLRIIKIGHIGDNVSKEVFLSQVKTKSWEFGELRGGTPLLSQPDANDGWLYGFIHSFKVNEKGFRRFYYYTAIRFRHFEKTFEFYPVPLRYRAAKPDAEHKMLWEFSNGGLSKVIFPIGVMHHMNGVLVSFGIDDVSTHIEYFSWKFIKNLFI